MPSALVILAPGAEEMETVITVDVLRRGGIEVTLAGLDGADPVECSRKMVIVPDKSLKDAMSSDYDAVICPGGMGGAESMAASAVVGQLLKKQDSRGAIVACICAAPIALKSHGIGKGKKITSHPAVEAQMKEGFTYVTDRVVVDNNIVTSRAPGTAFDFALALVEKMQGSAKKEEIMVPMLLK